MRAQRKTFKLANVIHRAYEHPETFEYAVPNDVTLGCYVKLIFTTGAGEGERMWVRVERVSGHRFVGTLANDPVLIDDLRFGDRIRFSLEHILAVCH